VRVLDLERLRRYVGAPGAPTAPAVAGPARAAA
jgi:hypothetical protein